MNSTMANKPSMHDDRPLLAPPRSRPQQRRASLFTTLIFVVALSLMALYYLLVAATAPCAVLSSSTQCYHGYRSAFSFDANRAHFPSWMAQLPDSTNLTSLSIPGTHDTMTYDLVDNRVLQCQNWALSVQLEAGLRYFDIRARLRDNDLYIYHGGGFTGHSYQEVLATMYDFLDRHPSETLVMRLKEEGSPIGSNNSRTFEQAFNSYHNATSSFITSPATAAAATNHLHVFNSSAPLPTLGHLRSKIFLLQNFAVDSPPPSSTTSKPKSDKYGLAWDGPQMFLEDDWIIPSVDYLLPQKWKSIRSALERSSLDYIHDPRNNSLLYLAHVSASVGVLPIQAAAGPLENRTIIGMNDMTATWLHDTSRDTSRGGRAGIVILDFPGKRLIEQIIKRNDNVLKLSRK